MNSSTLSHQLPQDGILLSSLILPGSNCNSSRVFVGAAHPPPPPLPLKNIGTQDAFRDFLESEVPGMGWKGETLGCACTWWSSQLLRGSWVRSWSDTDLQSGMSFQPSKVWFMCCFTPIGAVYEKHSLAGQSSTPNIYKSFASFFWYYSALDGNHSFVVPPFWEKTMYGQMGMKHLRRTLWTCVLTWHSDSRVFIRYEKMNPSIFGLHHFLQMTWVNYIRT